MPKEAPLVLSLASEWPNYAVHPPIHLSDGETRVMMNDTGILHTHKQKRKDITIEEREEFWEVCNKFDEEREAIEDRTLKYPKLTRWLRGLENGIYEDCNCDCQKRAKEVRRLLRENAKMSDMLERWRKAEVVVVD